MNQLLPLNILIVGAGIAGLTLARALSPKYSVTVFEKSPGLGGRIATRRKDSGLWDHGIPSISREDIPDSLWNVWAPYLQPIPESSSAQFMAPSGLTEIAKLMAKHLTVLKKCRITQVLFQSESSTWRLIDENLQEYLGDVLVLAVPVPQALELFKANPTLDSIKYRSQLVALGIASSEIEDLKPPKSPSSFERIVDNGKKGLRNSFGFFSAYLTQEFSEKHFEEEPESLIPLIRKNLSMEYGIEASHLEIKKWRYSQCTEPSSSPYEQGQLPFSSLYYIGDGFSGGGFRGAVLSALSLASDLSRLNP